MRQCPRFHSLGPFSGDQSEKTIYARISGSISEHCWWQSLRMLPSFIVVRVKGSFSIFVGKLKKQLGRRNILKISFDSGRALSQVDCGRKTFVVGSYLIEGAERKEARGT